MTMPTRRTNYRLGSLYSLLTAVLLATQEPFSALAALSGPLAPEYADALRAAGSVSGPGGVSGIGGAGGISLSQLPDGRTLVQAPDHTTLCDLLGAVPRPSGRGLRVEVDPTAI